MTQTVNISSLQETIEAQKRIINTQREKLQWYENILGNKKLPINMRLATIAARTLEETRKPDENGYYRAHLPALAEVVGVSASTISRGLKNLADCTQAVEHLTVPDKDEPYKQIVYIRPTDLLDRPQEIAPIKEIKRHGGDHRIFCDACGSEDIVEQKKHVCRSCGNVVKQFADREVNTPLQDATGESESDIMSNMPVSEATSDNSSPLQDATYTVDTLVSSASCNTINAPEELQALPQWVVWKYEQKPGKAKRDKVPYNIHRAAENARADVSDPRTWSTYDEAKALVERSQRWHTPYTGVGFVFKAGGGIVGIDYDNSLETRIHSYSEISVSGNGVHTYVHGSIPKGTRRNGIEMYDSGRFFTWTGNHLAGTPEVIEDCQTELDTLYKELAPETIPIQPTPGNFTCSRSDEEILEKARNARNGAKFTALYGGDWSGYHSQSEADQALCKMLAYWADNDVSTIDRLFQQSRLYRDKWNEKRGSQTYGEITMYKAIGQNWQIAS